MDCRLFDLAQQRPRSLRQQDLPTVSVALVCAVLKQASITIESRMGIDYVWIRGQGVDITVLRADWEKILPYFLDGTFEPSQTPVPNISPAVGDSFLYRRILNTMKQLFLDEFPTSSL
jgi:hypothetical protein